MKLRFTWILFLLPLLAMGQTGISFDQNATWNAVLAKAAAEHKFIFVDCYTTWCGPCRMMDANVYPNPEVGKLLNKAFLSVKVQFDQTKEDNPYVKSWYQDAINLTAAYGINAFPTLLFFSPEGKLLHRVIGYQSIEDFFKQANFALDPARAAYANDIQNYKDGDIDTAKLLSLYITTRDIVKDTLLEKQLGNDYQRHLDKLAPSDWLTKDILEFASKNLQNYDLQSKYVKVLTSYPTVVDSLAGPGTAKYFLTLCIKNDLQNKLWQGKQIIITNPDWNKLTNKIQKDYPLVDAYNLVMDLRIGPISPNGMADGYDHVAGDYKDLVKYTQLRIDSLAKLNTPESTFGINLLAYWSIFTKVAYDRTALNKGLIWANLSISLDKQRGIYPIQTLDTKANLLYKLGRRKEAIQTETEALKGVQEANIKYKLPKDQGGEIYITTIRQMKNGEKTGLSDGAKW